MKITTENKSDEDELGLFLNDDSSSPDLILEVYQQGDSAPRVLHVHRIILSSRSSYFRKALNEPGFVQNGRIQITTQFNLMTALVRRFARLEVSSLRRR
jgi:hypothetical protein